MGFLLPPFSLQCDECMYICNGRSTGEAVDLMASHKAREHGMQYK